MNQGLKILLLPFAFIYGVITLIRNRLYDSGILKVSRFDVHTIGVGNLSVGGAGKTPLVEYLIRLLRTEETKIATLSRGYKRKTSGFILADNNSTAEDIGDEPLIYKYKYNIQVAVDANRVNGVKKLIAIEENAPRIILLDDVFQHRAIKCGLNIVVSDFNNLYFNDTMLPAGTLREFKSGIIRADIIIVTKVPDRTSPVEIRNILKDINPKAHQQVFFSYLNYGELYSINNSNEKINTLNDLFRYRIISFAGIANAQTMVSYLKEYSADVKHLPFNDHHGFSVKDLEDIERYYNSFEGGNKILVTTEKDFMRLKSNLVWKIAQRMNIYILPVEMTFKDKEEEFNQEILKYVRTNRIYHQKYS
ncbi:MAG: tetraacyldisaccharide 4'-kinase [Bacteroidota bacterium]|nr:tetraacyldisaccharide 4'-kinase [Bacteroidota bacterium]MDP3146294.1 tetraacyldisaccharide 4'-kinase [Bacteroidota bacterium]